MRAASEVSRRDVTLGILGGGLLVAVPHPPWSWLARFAFLGWSLEFVARATGQAPRSATTPGLRRAPLVAWRTAAFLAQSWLAFLPGSALLYMAWMGGWVISFERVVEHRMLAFQFALVAMLMIGATFAWMPAATMVAARAPGKWAVWRVGEVIALIRLDPCRYLRLLGVTWLAAFALQVMRQPRLQAWYEHLAVGWLSAALIVFLRLAWSRYFRTVTEGRATAGKAASGRAMRVVPWMVLVGFLYAFVVVGSQFVIMGPETEWFAHSAFLLPGAPAPQSPDPSSWGELW